MQMAEISVMVCVYNGEAYLPRCMDSILSQNFRDFELIVVNDGSVDGTLEILERYAAQDDRIRIVSQENRGLSAARNTAVQASSGQWLVFVDADDWVDPDYLSYLRMLRDKTGMPVAACNHWIEAEKGRNARSEVSEKISLLSLQEAQLSVMYSGVVDVSAWAKIYRRDILEAIRYPEGRLFEDTARAGEVLEAAGGIAVGSHPAYHYRFSDNSISKKVNILHLWDFVDAVDHMLSRFDLTEECMQRGAVRRRTHAALSTMRLQVTGGSPDWSRALHTVRRNALSVLRDPMAPGRDKVGVLAALPGKKCFELVWGAYALTRRKY